MARIYFVHWHEEELQDLSAPLHADGHEVFGHHYANRAARWDGFDPDLVVISLERLPSHGRAIADWVLKFEEATKRSIIFVGGEKEKVAATKERYPSAVYCSVEAMRRAVADVLSGKRKAAVAPGYEVPKGVSATPLAKKLGVTDGVRFALVDPPDGFDRTLAAPKGAVQVKFAGKGCDVVVFFARSSKLLTTTLAKLKAELAPEASLWLAWPKKTSALASDLSDEVVRQLGLRSGLVDVKVCAIDETWSGLKFMHRVKDRPKQPKKRDQGT